MNEHVRFGGVGAVVALTLISCGPFEETPLPGDSEVVHRGLAADLVEKDIAWAFTPSSRDLVRASEALFSRDWYDSVDRAFRATDVADALVTESRYEDWNLLSARVAPCVALGPTPTSDVERLCWPELRLVFQPIIRNVRIHERTSEAFVDDRAIHAIYPVVAGLTAAEVAQAERFKSQLKSAPLSAADMASFLNLRNKAIEALIGAARALRGAQPASAFTGLGTRPEEGSADAKAFKQRLLRMLATFARPSDLRELTAFSLPAGREPAHLDAWAFIAFSARGGVLTAKNVDVTSHLDGRRLFSFGLAEVVSMGADDPRVLAATEPALRETIVRQGSDIARLTPVLRDRRQRLVPNTSCGSCHMMNGLRFDFHNFGYLEDRDLTISPRVRSDVELDLTFVRARR